VFWVSIAPGDESFSVLLAKLIMRCEAWLASRPNDQGSFPLARTDVQQ
jgi:hypothetical protein